MLALHAKIEAGWVLVRAAHLSEFLFFRYLKIRSKQLSFTACKFRFFAYFCLVMLHDSIFVFTFTE